MKIIYKLTDDQTADILVGASYYTNKKKKVKTHDSPKEFPRKYQEVNYRVLQIKFQEKSIMGKQSSQRYVQQLEFSNYLVYIYTRHRRKRIYLFIYKYRMNKFE